LLVFLFIPVTLAQDWPASGISAWLVDNTHLQAGCLAMDKEYQTSVMDLNNCVANYNGQLTVCNSLLFK
jgi:hypothetical protein